MVPASIRPGRDLHGLAGGRHGRARHDVVERERQGIGHRGQRTGERRPAVRLDPSGIEPGRIAAEAHEVEDHLG